MSGPLVSAAWLADRLADPEVQVLDATWRMPGDPRSGAQDHAEGHIPGAVSFDIDALSDPESPLPHMLPAPEAFARAAGALGLRRDATIVCYDALGIFSAPRAWWTLRVMGFRNVHVLDGGLVAWRAEGRPLETAATQPTPVRLEARFDADLVRSLDDMRAAVASGDVQVVDARPAPRFRGEAAEPRPGLRSGHMPGAYSLPFTQLVGPDGRMVSDMEITAAFIRAGVDLTAPLVTTCGSGISAAVLALGLARLGRDDVAVYDGSWAEWGGRADTPLATGA